MAQRFGWTLDEVDALKLIDIEELSAIDDGRDKAHESEKKSQTFFGRFFNK